MRCADKRRYRTRWDAKRALKHIQTMGLSVRRIYRCHACREYHLTSQRN